MEATQHMDLENKSGKKQEDAEGSERKKTLEDEREQREKNFIAFVEKVDSCSCPKIKDVCMAFSEIWDGEETLTFGIANNISNLLLIASQKLENAKKENKRLKIERDEWKEFSGQLGESEQAKWEAFRKQMGKGRKAKAIDWARYDKLVEAEVTQKDKAKILGVSVGTLREKVKARKAGNL